MNTTAINIDDIYLLYKVLIHFYTICDFFLANFDWFIFQCDVKRRVTFSQFKILLDILMHNLWMIEIIFLFVTKLKKKLIICFNLAYISLTANLAIFS